MSPAARRLIRPAILVPSVVAVGALGVGLPVAVASRPDVAVTGLRDDAVLGKGAVSDLVVRASASGVAADKLTVRLDGRPAQVSTEGEDAVWRPTGLGDGKHTLTVTAPGRLVGSTSVTRTFTVDTTPPRLKVTTPDDVPSLRSAVKLTGTVDGTATVTADDKPVKVEGGRFVLDLAAPPAALKLVAKDEAGNTTTDVVSVPVRHPMIRGVHVTGYAWNYKGLRDGILALIKAKKINTVELDIKEEDGFVNYDTSVKLAHEAGAIRKLYEPKAVIAQLHKMGIRVVGRIVCFRDPKLAPWAWAHGHKDWVVQAPDGSAYNSARYGAISFTNFANQDVRDYNIALATEAAKLGFDDVMYDYVRRPDGPLSKMKFVGLTTTPPQGVTEFVKETAGPVRANGAYLGLAVFGVSATRPKEVGQSIPDMAKYVDYVAPMVYPSHWAPGEYKVANPNAQPYDIVFRSLKDFVKKVGGTDAQVMPWLQDFSLGVTYGPAQVATQIKATFDDKLTSFFLWNAGCRYTGVAIPTLPAG